MSVEDLRVLIRETLDSLTYRVMQIDPRDVKTPVTDKSGNDWVGSRADAEALVKKLSRKKIAKHLNFRYGLEPID